MSRFRFARLALMLAALGLNAAPALMHSASAQDKDAKPAAAPADAVRPDLAKLMDPAQLKPLIDAKNFTEAMNRVNQAAALPNLTPYESYVVNRNKLLIATYMADEKTQMTALEALLASDKLPAADRATFLAALANNYWNVKDYAKAADLYKQAQAAGNNSDAVNANLVRAYYLSNNFTEAVKLQRSLIDAEEKAGKTPSQDELRLYYSSAVKLKDDPTTLVALEKLASYYPSDDFWTDLVQRGVLRKPGFNDAYITDVLRLDFAALKAMPAEYYVELAESVLKDGFPTEAKKVVDAGFAAGVLGTGNQAPAHRQLRDRATKEAANDAKTIAAGETSAAKTGTGLVNLGWAYVTMDQFDKGIGFLERGIAKGGLKQPDEAKLRLGMAYARAGQKDKAIQTFQTVKAGGGLADTAHYWIVLLNHPNTGAGAAAAK